MHKKDGGIIENWQMHTMASDDEALAKAKEAWPDFNMDVVAVFTGTVKEDPTGRWQPGYHMRSTLILNLDRETGVCETQNTMYKLENEGGDIFGDLGTGVMRLFY